MSDAADRGPHRRAAGAVREQIEGRLTAAPYVKSPHSALQSILAFTGGSSISAFVDPFHAVKYSRFSFGLLGDASVCGLLREWFQPGLWPRTWDPSFGPLVEISNRHERQKDGLDPNERGP